MSRPRLLQLCCAVLLLVGIAESVRAQNGMIKGKVRAPSGTTLTGVIVELWRVGGMEGQTVTTRDGDFEFTNLTPASYEIVIKQQGYQVLSERAEFHASRNSGRIEILTMDITLKPDSREAPLPAGPATTFVQNIPPAAQKAYNEGVQKLKESKPIEGVASLQEAITLFPDYFSAHYVLAGELARQKKINDALAELEQARRINDRSAEVYHLFGMLMGQQKKYSVAEYAFRQAIDRNPLGTASYISHAVVLIELVKSDKESAEYPKWLNAAENDLNRAIELSKEKMASPFLHRAQVKELKKDKKGAVLDLERYLKLNPDTPNQANIREAITRLSAP